MIEQVTTPESYLNTALILGNGGLSAWILFIVKGFDKRITFLERGHMKFNGEERRKQP